MSADLLTRLPDYFSSLIDAMQDGFVLRDRNGVILEVNRRYCDLIGYARDEVVGQRPPHPWWPADEQSAVGEAHRRYLSGATSEDDLLFVRKDGARLPVLVTSAPLRDRDGEIIGFIGTVKDITERQDAEQRIQFQARLIDHAQVAIIGTDRDGRVTLWNQGAQALYGWSRDQALGADINALLVAPEGEPSAVSLAGRALAGEPREGEFVIQRQDGAPVPVYVNDTPLFGTQGEVVGIVSVSVDITARRKVEQRLHVKDSIARSIAQANSLEDTAHGVLRAIGQELRWDIGVFWLADEATRRLRPLATWQQPALAPGALKAAGAFARFTRGEGLPGVIWETGRPRWIEDATQDDLLAHHTLAMEAGMRSAFAFPTFDAHGVSAVLEFLSHDRRPADDGLFEMAATVGSLVGQFMQRMRAEFGMRESEERFRTMANSAPVMLWVAGVDQGCIWFNDGWLDFTGRSIDQERGYGWADLLHPDDRKRCLAIRAAAFERREPYRLEFRLRRKDGDYRWVIDSGAPRFAPDGSFLGYVGSAVDIDDRKRAEDDQQFLADATRVLASSLDYRTTLNTVAKLVVPRLADWCAVHIVEEPGNYTLLAIAHTDPAKIEWARELQQKYPTDPNAPNGIPRVLRTGEPEFFPELPEQELIAAARDEEHAELIRQLRITSALIVPMIARDQTIGAISFVSAESGRHYEARDRALAEELANRAAVAVDNARLYKEAQEAASARDQFLAVAAHELRSPLTSTKGFAQLLLRRAARTPGGDEWIAPLRTIDNQVNKVATLVNRLLDVSRIQENRLQLQREPDDLLDITREVVSDQQLANETRRIILSSDVTELAGFWDRTRISQVLSNLLDNAVKYSPEGTEVTVSVRADDREALISVHNEGAGIPQETQQQIFTQYFRTLSATRSGSEGMGLGLYVAKGIVDAHGGRIWIESVPGDGATFNIALPLDAPAGTTDGADAPPAARIDSDNE